MSDGMRQKQNLKFAILSLLLAVFLSGCSWTGGTYELLDRKTTDQIQPYVSTKADVERLLGDDYSVSTSKEGSEVWTYEYYHHGWICLGPMAWYLNEDFCGTTGYTFIHSYSFVDSYVSQIKTYTSK